MGSQRRPGHGQRGSQSNPEHGQIGSQSSPGPGQIVGSQISHGQGQTGSQSNPEHGQMGSQRSPGPDQTMGSQRIPGQNQMGSQINPENGQMGSERSTGHSQMGSQSSPRQGQIMGSQTSPRQGQTMGSERSPGQGQMGSQRSPGDSQMGPSHGQMGSQRSSLRESDRREEEGETESLLLAKTHEMSHFGSSPKEERETEERETKQLLGAHKMSHSVSLKEEEEEEREEEGKREGRKKGWAILSPFLWLGMLCRELDKSVVFGVIVTYGVNQGFGGALYNIAGAYYWKDAQKVQPSAAQFYRGIISFPWTIKPFYGLFTDVVPVLGFHRRPYFVFSGLLTLMASLTIAFSSRLYVSVAVMLLMATSLGTAIADVTIDAVIATKSRDRTFLAADMQTLCSVSSAMGSLVGFSVSGIAVQGLGPKGALGLISSAGVLLFILGFILSEIRHPNHISGSNKAMKKLRRVVGNTWITVKCPQVWKPSLYMFISWATIPSIKDAKLYWYSDSDLGLGLSKGFIGGVFAIASTGALLGTLVYQKFLRSYSFRTILFWAQLLLFFSGIFDLVLVLRWNLKMHMPDSVFIILDELISSAILRLKWVPQLVLCAKLCPAGVEGTLFALLMSIDNVGLLLSSSSGGLLLHLLGVTRDNFTNLWLATLIQTLLKLLPLSVLFLVPNTDPSITVLPIELSQLVDDKDSEEMVELNDVLPFTPRQS